MVLAFTRVGGSPIVDFRSCSLTKDHGSAANVQPSAVMRQGVLGPMGLIVRDVAIENTLSYAL